MSDPMQDQWNAAVEDARRRLHNVNPGGIDVVEVDMRKGNVDEMGARERMLAHVIAHYAEPDGASPGCGHVTGAPAVVFGAAAWPGKVFCGDCFQMTWKVYESLWRGFGCFTPCDNCHGKPVPGNVDGSSTGVVNWGPVMLTISLCADCTRVKLEGGD
jgi:hypothetical protein